jgi:hypothetical protein
VTNASTAEFVLMTSLNGEEVIIDENKRSKLLTEVDPKKVIDLATVIKVMIYQLISVLL